jgi:hypothetical protein
MDAMTVAAAASAITGATAATARAWLHTRMQRQQAREHSRREHLQRLPPGSRVVDLGEHGIVIDVGGRADVGASDPHGTR